MPAAAVVGGRVVVSLWGAMVVGVVGEELCDGSSRRHLRRRLWRRFGGGCGGVFGCDNQAEHTRLWLMHIMIRACVGMGEEARRTMMRKRVDKESVEGGAPEGMWRRRRKLITKRWHMHVTWASTV